MLGGGNETSLVNFILQLHTKILIFILNLIKLAFSALQNFLLSSCSALQISINTNIIGYFLYVTVVLLIQRNIQSNDTF